VEVTKPWVLAKDGKEKELHTFLFLLGNMIRILTILLAPVLTKGVKSFIKEMNFSSTQLLFKNIKKYDVLNKHKVSQNSKPIYIRYN
jgi:methionyl-tRNA synthetase